MEEKLKNPKVLVIAGIVIVLVVICIAAFTKNQSTNTQAEKQIEGTISTIPQTQGGGTQSGTISNSTNSNKENTPKQYAQVTVGQAVTIEDYLEYSFIETRFTNRIDPTNPDTYYSYYQAKSEGCTLIAVKVKIKNLQAEEFDGEDIPKATIMYNNKYKYDCSLIVEEDDGSDLEGYDWYMNIEPLKSKTFYYYAEIPNDVETDTNPLAFRIELKGNGYELKIK